MEGDEKGLGPTASQTRDANPGLGQMDHGGAAAGKAAKAAWREGPNKLQLGKPAVNGLSAIVAVVFLCLSVSPARSRARVRDSGVAGADGFFKLEACCAAMGGPWKLEPKGTRRIAIWTICGRKSPIASPTGSGMRDRLGNLGNTYLFHHYADKS